MKKVKTLQNGDCELQEQYCGIRNESQSLLLKFSIKM